jgi:hypothetical protein
MTKEKILTEIRRTAAANGGAPLGSRRFADATSIREADWLGKHWARWGDALREAGFAPIVLQGAYDKAELLDKFARLAQELGRLPTANDLRLKDRTDPSYPNQKVFERLGSKAELVRMVEEFCEGTPGFEDVITLCQEYTPRSAPQEEASASKGQLGFVYLLRHGSRREYKIGRTNNPIRREGEVGVELPLKLEPIHVITTDDPAGIEAYWHRRFAEKRLKNEWFALTADDVRAFKRWRRIT